MLHIANVFLSSDMGVAQFSSVAKEHNSELDV